MRLCPTVAPTLIVHCGTQKFHDAQVVWAHAQELLEAGLKPQDIGIITPYNAQVTRLRGLRPAHLAALEVSTVDGFQGGSAGRQCLA